MEEDIKIVEDYIKHFEGKLVDVVAIGNLLVGYKNLEQENKELWEANAKLGYEIGKRDAEINQLNKIIDKMAEEIFIKRAWSITCKEDIPELKERIIKKYREEVEE